ncbi:MAG: hypothetical protein ACI9SG_000930, partial [Maribacter sp.]
SKIYYNKAIYENFIKTKKLNDMCSNFFGGKPKSN